MKIKSRIDNAIYYLILSAKYMALCFTFLASFVWLAREKPDLIFTLGDYWLFEMTITIAPVILFFSSIGNMVLFFVNIFFVEDLIKFAIEFIKEKLK